jgi:hypothetical protein
MTRLPPLKGNRERTFCLLESVNKTGTKFKSIHTKEEKMRYLSRGYLYLFVFSSNSPTSLWWEIKQKLYFPLPKSHFPREGRLCSRIS